MFSLRGGLRAGAGIVLLLLSGCAYDGSGDPVSRKFSWFDYLGGGDIRAACAAGAADRYRLVYNAIYVEQVRTYDLSVNPDGSGTLQSRVFGSPKLSAFSIGGISDLTSPWRGEAVSRRLDAAAVAALDADIAASGAYGPAPEGLRLDSDRFYWTVAACKGGVFRFNAYQWPSDRFAALKFPERLFAWDETGVTVHPPREADTREIHGSNNPEGAARFTVEVGANGLMGAQPLF